MPGQMFGPTGVLPAVVVGGTTTLDPAFVNGSFAALSGGNLIVTCSSAGNNIARSVASHSSGKYYWEVTVGAASNFICGICSSTEVNSTFLTSDGKSAATFSGSGWLTGLSGTTTADTANLADTYAFAVDATAKLIWTKDLTRAGGPFFWNANVSADPASGALGANFSALTDIGTTAIYAAVTCAGAGDNCTFNFGATAYIGTPPAGFGNM